MWDIVFEGKPTPSDRGIVIGKELRDIRHIFKDAFSEEHTFDDSETPTIEHRVGNCSVVDIDGEAKNDARNGLVYSSGTLFLDSGLGSLDAMATARHNDLSNLLTDDAHTQYELVTDFDPSNMGLSFQGIYGIETGRSTSDYESDDSAVVPQGDHLSADSFDGVQHSNKVIPASFGGIDYNLDSIPFPGMDFEKVESTTESYIRETNICSMPIPAVGSSARVVVRGSSQNYNDFFPSFNLSDANSATEEAVHYWRRKISNKIYFIDVTSDDYVLADNIGSLSLSSGDIVWFTVGDGVYITTKSLTDYALRVGSNWPSNVGIVLENKGWILGCGGNGGDADVEEGPEYDYSVTGDAGEDGGPALNADFPMAIINKGVIGGGGGGGGSYVHFSTVSQYVLIAVAGGGAGAGKAYSSGRPEGGKATTTDLSSNSFDDTDNGNKNSTSSSTWLTGASGGSAYLEAGGVSASSNGGKGGNLGQSGSSGNGSGNEGGQGGSPGAGGTAINTVNNVHYIMKGDIRGSEE